MAVQIPIAKALSITIEEESVLHPLTERSQPVARQFSAVKPNIVGKVSCLLSAACLCLLSFTALSEEEQPGAGFRWFEVEVLVFKQDAQNHTDEEYFPLQVQPIPLTRYDDLLSPLRGFDSAPIAASLLRPCLPPQEDTEPWLPVLNNHSTTSRHVRERLSRDPLCIEEGEQALVESWYHAPVELTYSGPREVAESIIDGPGGNMLASQGPFILPSSAHSLNSLRQRLESQSGKATLLHTTWRQPVFSRNQGRKIRLFGGENFSRDFDYLGFARDHYLSPLEPLIDDHQIQRAEQHSPLPRIEALLGVIEAGGEPFRRPDTQALALPDKPQQYPPNLPIETWEFDGLMHIYLVGNYLHIDGEFNLREEIEVPLQASSLDAQADAALRQEEAVAPFLKAYYYNQLRRVISHETHYFDHPRFGVVVQIRRTDLSSRR